MLEQKICDKKYYEVYDGVTYYPPWSIMPLMHKMMYDSAVALTKELAKKENL